jgi:hypothetical protein
MLLTINKFKGESIEPIESCVNVEEESNLLQVFLNGANSLL